MSRLPKFVQLLFPVELTPRGGMEHTVTDQLARDVVNGRSFSDIRAGLQEHQALVHGRAHLAYLSFAKSRKVLQRKSAAVYTPEVLAIPSFPEKTLYVPSVTYLISRFFAWYGLHEEHIRRWLASVDGRVWRLDWTFSDTRYTPFLWRMWRSGISFATSCLVACW